MSANNDFYIKLKKNYSNELSSCTETSLSLLNVYSHVIC